MFRGCCDPDHEAPPEMCVGDSGLPKDGDGWVVSACTSPCSVPFGAQSTQETSCFADTSWELCLSQLQQLTSYYTLLLRIPLCSTTLPETWPASSFVLLPRQMSRQYLGDSGSPRATALPSPPGSGNTGKDPEKLFWVGCGEMLSARPMTSVNYQAFYSLSAWKFPCMGRKHGYKFPSLSRKFIHFVPYCLDQ